MLKSHLIVYQAFHPKTIERRGMEIEDPVNFNRYFEFETEILRSRKEFMTLPQLSGGIKRFLKNYADDIFYLKNLPLKSENSSTPSVSQHIRGYGQALGAELALPLPSLQYKELKDSLVGIENLDLKTLKTRLSSS